MRSAVTAAKRRVARVLKGALAAALTPLRDGGAALDEDAFGPYCDFLRGRPRRRARARDDRRGDPALDGGAEARSRSSSSTVPAARDRALRRADDGGRPSSSRRTPPSADADGGRGDRAAVLPARRRRAARALRRRRARVRADCRSTSTSSRRASGYAVPLAVLERLREHAPNLVGLKVSDTPWDAFEPYLLEGLDVFVGPEALISQGLRRGRGRRGLRRSRRRSRSASPRRARSGRGGALGPGELRAAIERFPLHAALKHIVARDGRADARGRARAAAAAHATTSERSSTRGSNRRSRRGRDRRLDRVPPRAARRDGRRPRGHGARSRPARPRRRWAACASSSRRPPRCVLAQESIRFFESLGAPLLRPGRLPLPRDDRGRTGRPRGAARAPGGARRARRARRPAVRPGPARRRCARRRRVLEDGVADPPAVARELVRRAAELGRGGARATRTRSSVDGDVLVIACGPRSAERGRCARSRAARPAALPAAPAPGRSTCRTSCRWSSRPRPAFHFRRRGDRLVLAMTDPEPRWGVRRGRRRERSSRTGSSGSRTATRPRPGATIADAWAGLYDMTPDAHPIIGRVGDGVYAACGFSGHGFMQSPGVGMAVAEELLGDAASFDLDAVPARALRRRSGVPRDLVL